MKTKVIIDRGEEVANGLSRTKVTLEDLTVQAESKDVLAIIGRIRVANLSFGKFVFARVTFNNWASYRDYSATYTESSNDGSDDTYAFGFTRRDKRPVYVEFSLSCVQNGQQFWDNNGGKNYCFQLGKDPFSDPESAQIAEPEILTTWQVAEESSPQQEEIIFDTSSYPHFQAHPLAPTKLHLYAKMRNVPEKQVVPTKVQDSKHVRAFNALAFESLLIVEEKPQQVEDGEIQATMVSAEEAGVALNSNEANEFEGGEQETLNSAEENQIIQEDAVEAITVVKPVDDDNQDEVFAKLAQENSAIVVDLQIIEEPGTDEVAGGERNDIQQPAGQNGVAEEQLQQTNLANADESQEEEHQQQKQKVDIKVDEKKKRKKDKKKQKKKKHEQKAGEDNEQRPSPDVENVDDHSVSSKKERIEDGDVPKKPKKSFLSRMACCGKAEPD